MREHLQIIRISQLSVLTVGVIATLAVATASNDRALQGGPQIQELGPEITSVAPGAGLGSGIRAGIGSGDSTLKKSTFFNNDDLASIEAIRTSLGISAGSSPFGGLGYNTGIGSLAHGGALGLAGGLGEAGLGGLGYGAGLDTVYGSLLGSGGIGTVQASSGRIPGMGGDGVGYSTLRTYNYNYDSREPSAGAKKIDGGS